MSDANVISLAETKTGYFVRVAGRGTMKESAPLHEFLLEAISRGVKAVSIDLSCCVYLDSTFLGSLVDLFKTARRKGSSLIVCRPSEACRLLLDKTRLSTFLRIEEELPATISELTPILATKDSPADLPMGRHILSCHKHLAEIESPSQKAFAAVADQLEKELAARN